MRMDAFFSAVRFFPRDTLGASCDCLVVRLVCDWTCVSTLPPPSFPPHPPGIPFVTMYHFPCAPLRCPARTNAGVCASDSLSDSVAARGPPRVLFCLATAGAIWRCRRWWLRRRRRPKAQGWRRRRWRGQDQGRGGRKGQRRQEAEEVTLFQAWLALVSHAPTPTPCVCVWCPPRWLHACVPPSPAPSCFALLLLCAVVLCTARKPYSSKCNQPQSGGVWYHAAVCTLPSLPPRVLIRVSVCGPPSGGAACECRLPRA
jgi:hypothetical protein